MQQRRYRSSAARLKHPLGCVVPDIRGSRPQLLLSAAKAGALRRAAGPGAERGEGLTPWLLCARVSARLRGSVRKETWQTVQLGNLPLPLLGASPSEGAAEASGWQSRGRAWCAALRRAWCSGDWGAAPLVPILNPGTPRGDVKAPNPWASPPPGDTGGVKLH